MHAITEGVDNKQVFTVRDMPHFAPYLQFLVNIIQIHFEYVKLGGKDYNISGSIDRKDLDTLYSYLYRLEPGAVIEIGARDARVLYAGFVVVSRLLLCDYGENICRRLTRKLPAQHPWSEYEAFRNVLLRHNTQMLMDMDNNMSHLIPGLDRVKEKLEMITL